MANEQPINPDDLQLLKKLDAIGEAFESAWDLGNERPSIEQFSKEHRDIPSDRLIRELVKLEIELRSKQGEQLTSEPYLERFPELEAIWLEELISKAGVIESASAAADEDATIPPTRDKATDSEDATLPPKKSAESNAIGFSNFGDYEIISEIGRGGMAVVYKARQKSLNRIVALKMILSGQFASEEEIQRFRGEAEAAANLDFHGIVPVHEIGEHDGHQYFSMGFIEGESLQAKIIDGPLPAKEAAKLTAKIAEAVGFAHENGVIHRDLKPANIMIDQAGEPKVADFGLAKRVNSDSNLTRTSQEMGSPCWMPPEQASGKSATVDERADVYALGAILYNLITGRPPFQGSTPVNTMLQVIENEPVTPRTLDPKIPVDIETIALKCLEKDPNKRYRSAADLKDELNRFISGEPIQARPIGRAARALRWCKRKPALAGIIALAVLVLILVGTLAPYIAYQSTKMAEAEREKAKEQTRLTEEAQKLTYDVRLKQVGEQAIENPGAAFHAIRDNEIFRPELQDLGYRLVSNSSRRQYFEFVHDDVVSQFCFSSDSQYLFTGEKNGRVLMWDLQKGKKVKELLSPQNIELEDAEKNDATHKERGWLEQIEICNPSSVAILIGSSKQRRLIVIDYQTFETILDQEISGYSIQPLTQTSPYIFLERDQVFHVYDSINNSFAETVLEFPPGRYITTQTSSDDNYFYVTKFPPLVEKDERFIDARKVDWANKVTLRIDPRTSPPTIKRVKNPISPGPADWNEWRRSGVMNLTQLRKSALGPERKWRAEIMESRGDIRIDLTPADPTKKNRPLSVNIPGSEYGVGATKDMESDTKFAWLSPSRLAVCPSRAFGSDTFRVIDAEAKTVSVRRFPELSAFLTRGSRNHVALIGGSGIRAECRVINSQGNEVRRIDIKRDTGINGTPSVRFSTDEKWIGVSYASKTVYVARLARGLDSIRISPIKGSVRSIKLLDNNQKLVVFSDQEISCWNLASQDLYWRITPDWTEPQPVSISDDCEVVMTWPTRVEGINPDGTRFRKDQGSVFQLDEARLLYPTQSDASSADHLNLEHFRGKASETGDLSFQWLHDQAWPKRPSKPEDDPAGPPEITPELKSGRWLIALSRRGLELLPLSGQESRALPISAEQVGDYFYDRDTQQIWLSTRKDSTSEPIVYVVGLEDFSIKKEFMGASLPDGVFRASSFPPVFEAVGDELVLKSGQRLTRGLTNQPYLSPSGFIARRMNILGKDSILEISKAAEDKPLRRIRFSGFQIDAATPNYFFMGDHLLTISPDYFLSVWEFATGREQLKAPIEVEDIRDLVVSRNGNKFAIGGKNSILIFDFGPDASQKQ